MFAFFCSILMGSGIAFTIIRSDQEETGIRSSTNRKFKPYLSPILLLSYVAALLILLCLSEGIRNGFSGALAVLFPIFIHILLYNCVLLLSLPLLRRYISARVCAMLWMLPNYLYMTQNICAFPAPLIILPIPKKLEPVLLGVWLTGFALFFGWKLISHWICRRKLLSQAVPMEDPETFHLWYEARAEFDIFPPSLPLYRCAAISTPMSIGLSRKSIRVLLPEKVFTPEELKLIFRHELIHITRGDSAAKLTMTFFTSLFWFNPLSWIAARRCADDLELSCDESVLLNSDGETRRRYGELLLRTAGNDQGFSTCLSASAKTMLYRLKNTLAPRDRTLGAVTAGIIFAVLLLTCGLITVSIGEDSGATYLFTNESAENLSIEDIRFDTLEHAATDEAALKAYLMELKLSKLAGNYTYEDSVFRFSASCQLSAGRMYFLLSDEIIFAYGTLGGETVRGYYYLTEPVEWEYLSGLLKKL